MAYKGRGEDQKGAWVVGKGRRKVVREGGVGHRGYAWVDERDIRVVYVTFGSGLGWWGRWVCK